MTRTFILTAVTVMLVPLGVLRAQDVPPEAATTAPEAAAPEAAASEAAASEAASEPLVDLAESYDEFVGGGPDNNPNLVYSAVPWQPRLAARLGWWGVASSGAPWGVGEWQGLSSSTPFWDVQGLTSDGLRTLDFYANGPEDESKAAGLNFYAGPFLSLDVDYDQLIHRLGHNPLGGLPDANGFPPPGGFFDPVLSDGDGGIAEQPGYVMFGEDFNRGQDYAIRVNKFDAKFQGNITENIKWRLNVWAMEKKGVRSANSQQHCYAAVHPVSGDSTNTCHVVSQGQRIDWLTVDVEPAIEVRLGRLTVEYSRTMRSFEQNDQMVLGDFSRDTSYGFGVGAEAGAYAYVPENTTAIDRVKIGGDLGLDTDLYVVGHTGNTHNRFRDSDRKFYGVDARVTNTSIEGVSLTAYGKTFSQNNSADTASLNDRYPAQSSLWLEQNIYGPVTGVPESPQTIYVDPSSPDTVYYLGLADRDIWEVGLRGRWRPFEGNCGPAGRLAVTGGYEVGETRRTNVTYALEELTPPVRFTQPTTVTNEFFVGLEEDWSRTVNTYVRYRFTHNSWPLAGVTYRQQLNLDSAINSNQPEQVDRVEIGGTWNPADNFLVNASFWLENASNHSEYVNFDEDSYPFVVSAWYAPNECWSFTAGYAAFSNWIDQDITLGRQDGDSSDELTAWTAPWSYGGRADVINLGAGYAVSCDLRLTGGFEYVRGSNLIGQIPTNTYDVGAGPVNVTYPEIPGYSQVNVNTYRLTAGVDYDLTRNVGTFFRYNYYNYDDLAMTWNAGTAHMVLVGVSGVY